MQLLFLHNILIRFLSKADLLNIGYNYDLVVKYKPNLFAFSNYHTHILIHVETIYLEKLLKDIIQISFNKHKNISIIITDKESDPTLLLSKYFPFIKSAGGLVIKENYILMIYRANNWDFPKGKIEQNESSEEAAVREVQEECGVKAAPQQLFYTTWHFFQTNGAQMIKETVWYTMNCLDDTNMMPQREEAIELVDWIDINQLQPILDNTYASIKLLLQAYKNQDTLRMLR